MSESDPVTAHGIPQKRWFPLELWERVRPALLYILEELILVLMLLVKDGIIAACLRLGGWAFHELGKHAPVGGQFDEVFNAIHAVGILISYVLFAVLFIRDVWRMAQGGSKMH